MKKVYLISYDLNRPGQDYSGLHTEIKNNSTWWHFLDSTWLIYTYEKADQIVKRLEPHIDKNDFLLVIDVGNDPPVSG